MTDPLPIMPTLHRFRPYLLLALLWPAFLAAQDNSAPPPSRNPFLYPGNDPAARTPGGTVPVAGNYLPAGVRVRATVQLDGRPPAAVVEVPGYPNLFHLHVGDQFSLDGGTGSRRTAANAGANAAIVFTVVTIDRHTVTLSQSRQPGELIVIR